MNYKACCQLGITYMKKKNVEQSAEYLKKSLRIRPDYFPAVMAMGNLMYDVELFETSIKYFRQAALMAPDECQALMGLANAYTELRSPKAIALYLQILEVDATLPEVHFNLGNAYYNTDQLGNAVKAYLEEIRLNPSKIASYYNLGNCYYRLGDHKKAMYYFLETLRLDPKHEEAVHNLNFVYRLTNNFEQSLKQSFIQLQSNPHDPESHLKLATVLKQNCQYEMAKHHCRQVLQYPGDHFQAVYMLGEISEKFDRNYLDAFVYYNRAQKLQSLNKAVNAAKVRVRQILRSQKIKIPTTA